MFSQDCFLYSTSRFSTLLYDSLLLLVYRTGGFPRPAAVRIGFKRFLLHSSALTFLSHSGVSFPVSLTSASHFLPKLISNCDSVSQSITPSILLFSCWYPYISFKIKLMLGCLKFNNFSFLSQFSRACISQIR